MQLNNNNENSLIRWKAYFFFNDSSTLPVRLQTIASQFALINWLYGECIWLYLSLRKEGVKQNFASVRWDTANTLKRISFSSPIQMLKLFSTSFETIASLMWWLLERLNRANGESQRGFLQNVPTFQCFVHYS